MNLLEFFRKYPGDKVNINDYVNYCQMFYDYTKILNADYFQTHQELAEELAIQILISVLKGDQNYHYENIAFICNEAGEILRLAPMIDHEFSTYFMFPDSMSRHLYWFEQLQRSIAGNEVQPDEYADFTNEEERRLMEKSATCLHGNLVYIKEHYPKVTKLFLEKLDKLEADLRENKEMFYIQKSQNYPNHANSNAYLAVKPDIKTMMKKKLQFTKLSMVEAEKRYILIS